jgi:predicted negative regulator of RcsB-dependent stress response
MVITANENAWHLATNHLHTAADETGHSGCWRYDKMYQRLAETGGQLATQDALDLLAGVSQEGTQWSVVYGMRTGDVNVAMGRKYTAVHTFHLRLVDR